MKPVRLSKGTETFEPQQSNCILPSIFLDLSFQTPQTLNMGEPASGYYKFRCSYWQSHGCPNWVLVARTPCTTCVALGRDEIERLNETESYTGEISVPILDRGYLFYVQRQSAESEPAGEPGVIQTTFVTAASAEPVRAPSDNESEMIPKSEPME
ncbi:MAG: hypothetical protein MMC33_001781 [Icmadophila ericetorum]|nr:hypothetical protein [Icmadophila ericetorum]